MIAQKDSGADLHKQSSKWMGEVEAGPRKRREGHLLARITIMRSEAASEIYSCSEKKRGCLNERAGVQMRGVPRV